MLKIHYRGESLLPLICSFCLFGCVFISLFRTGLNYSNSVLIFDFFIVLFWLLFCLIGKKRNNAPFGSFFVKVVISILISFSFARLFWGHQYLSLNAINRLFNGSSFIDTLYHSVIAESFVTNGYSSIMQNDVAFLNYHCLSHLGVAIIAGLIRVPSFMVYNYVYPLVFAPLFLYLLFSIFREVKESAGQKLEVSDYVFLALAVLGFFNESVLTKFGFNYHSTVFYSESCFVSLVVVLFFFRTALWLCKNNHSDVVLWIIPLFLLLSLYAKISTGFLFLLGVLYYVLRKYFGKREFLWFFVYISVFLFYYKFYYKYSSGGASGSSASIISKIELFHYFKQYAPGVKAVVFYLYLTLPAVTLAFFYFTKNDCKVKKTFHDGKDILLEISVLLIIGCTIPGLFIKIAGGSAFYFVTPAYLFSVLMFGAYGFHNKLLDRIDKYVGISLGITIDIVKRNGYAIKASLVEILFVLYLVVMCLSLNIPSFCNRVLHYRKDYSILTFDDAGSHAKEYLFSKNQLLDDPYYVMLNNLRNDTAANKDDYCIYISEMDEFTERFPDYASKTYLINPCFAISAYTGLPIINAVYKEGNVYYRFDDTPFGTRDKIHEYSMPPKTMSGKMDIRSASERAKSMGKRILVVIEDCEYSFLLIDNDY